MTTSTLIPTLQGLVDALTAAEVEASLDPSDLNLPGVFVTLDRLTDWTLAGTAGLVRARLLLLGPDRDGRRALTELDTLLGEVMAVVSPTSDVEALPVAYQGADVPALSFTTDLEPVTTTEE